MSMPKALRRALSRTADILWDLALVTQAVTVEMLDQDEVVEALGPRDLLILLDGPEGLVGVASVAREVMTGVIEVQTIQQVTQMPVDEDRVLTQTDAAMMAPLLDGTLSRMADTLVDHPLHGQLTGYRFGAMIEDSRSAGLLLDAAAYRAFRAEVDLALGRRRGALTLFLPERRLKPGQGEADTSPGPHEEQLSRVPARLDAVLTRVKLPLRKAEALKPGDLLPLPPDVLDKVEITAGRGQLVARARLGQLNGARAVRLQWPVAGGAAKAAAGAAAAAAEEALTDFSGVPDTPDVPALAKPAAVPAPEELPDLPSLDFAADAADFDFGGIGDGDDDALPMESLPDIDMSDGFSSAAMEFDFDEQ
ncbi:FliM/FliN family flagellar motor C-terminal domain-containing protein [Maliponia aquimaris]|uniref:Surface presentation of antigens (SPOA) n=1 Tax=Maliponia aquimaris TaxID=1673631 RepID=A0A238L4K0_9RHOB|nr:FliM/FliN family flagellar motor C-terminal domain-containing protein [Maliponia aquimaris]SMX49949.1 Surface presentation of antigens (SPOA) [Maliponia aquimaris]